MIGTAVFLVGTISFLIHSIVFVMNWCSDESAYKLGLTLLLSDIVAVIGMILMTWDI